MTVIMGRWWGMFAMKWRWMISSEWWMWVLALKWWVRLFIFELMVRTVLAIEWRRSWSSWVLLLRAKYFSLWWRWIGELQSFHQSDFSALIQLHFFVAEVLRNEMSEVWSILHGHL